MTTSSENVQQSDTRKEPPSPLPRGGGDLSGKGARLPEADSDEKREDSDNPASEP